METKWTPGPWFIVTPTQGFEVCTIHGVERQPTEDGLGQSWVYIRPESLVRDGEWVWPDEAERTASAHLISSAPELYAALAEVLRIVKASDLWWMDAPDRGGFDVDAISSALAKARGEA